MGKAILVIDMPSCCTECKFLNDNYDYPMCIVTGETKGYTFRIGIHKMDMCPLRPIPEKSLTGNSDYYQWGDWEDGYNACIDEIVGE